MNNTIVVASSAPFDKGSGINTYAKELTNALLEKDFNVLYICPQAEKLDWLHNLNNIEAVFFEPFECPIEQTNIIKNAILKIDNLLGIINNDNIFLQSIAHLFSVPFISIVHLLNYAIYPAALINKDYVDYFVTISNDMCISFIRKSGIEPHRVPLIYNGITHSPFETKLLQKENSKLYLIAGGEYSKRKGGDLLKKLLQKLSIASIDFDFKWFGGVPQDIQEIFKNDDRFRFFKKLPRDEYMSYMKNGDIYLFPSREEGCPMSLIEAMSYGLVPIAADGIGAMNAIIQHGKNGYISSLKNWDTETYSLILFLSKNKKLINKLSTEAGKSIRETFTAQNTANDILELFYFPVIDRSVKNDSLDETFYIYNWHRLPAVNNLELNQKIKRGLLWRLGMVQKHSKLLKEERYY